YRPLEAWQPPINKFLKQAMRNLENGHHLYTKVENEMLVHFAWLTVPQSISSEGKDEWYAKLPAESAVISDYLFRQDEPLTCASLCQLLSDASRIKGVNSAYIRISSDNLPLKRTVEKLGFTCSYRLNRRQVLGRVTYG
ncbi:MAG: hypothetical protein J2P31_19910, partial [Blastocatellia bacterium]|nr:hypothetical protein [Blastocatellia bacterium]